MRNAVIEFPAYEAAPECGLPREHHPTEPRNRTYTQRLMAEPSAVFPLLCPVREVDWIDGWDPISIITHSGLAERDCVFVTAATPHDATITVSS